MSFAFDQNKWPVSDTRTGEGTGLSHPEWAGLRARMHAAHQARETLERVMAGGINRARGSFDAAAAQRLVSFSRDSSFVNPNDLTNRKPAGDMDVHVGGKSSVGGRG